LRILVIDDDAQDRFLVRRELVREFGAPEVVEVPDEAALERELHGGRFDLVVAGGAAEWGGPDVPSRVKAARPDCPLVVFAAARDAAAARAARAAGADGFVLKSAQHFHLLAPTVRSALDRAGRAPPWPPPAGPRPAPGPAAGPVGPSAPPGAPGRPLHILVCDDNVDGALTMALWLQTLRHQVRVVHDGEAALAAAAEQPPEVVLLDLALERGPDGCEVARRLRADVGLARTLLVAVTGFGQDEDRRRTSEAGFDLHLVKPVEPSVLLEALARAEKRPAGGASSPL
jgi:CheY-like chemotaxis protein